MEEREPHTPYPEETDRPAPNKSIRGYRIVIVILAVILAALSGLYFKIHRQQQQEYDYLMVQKDSIQRDLGNLMTDFDELQVANDTITRNLDMERLRADSLMQRLKRERSISYAKIREYEKKVGALRTLMEGYMRQIDSLNTLNKQLITENVGYRKQVASQTLRAEVAEEKAAELDTKLRIGSVVRARDIRLATLNANGKPVTRAARAARLKVDFVLSANELANPGERTVYVRITSPEGYLLANDPSATFSYEGSALLYTASREVDYQNDDLDVGLFYNGDGITAGTYTVQIYMDGYLVGTAQTMLR